MRKQKTNLKLCEIVTSINEKGKLEAHSKNVHEGLNLEDKNCLIIEVVDPMKEKDNKIEGR